MHVLSEFIRNDITDQQFPIVAPVLFPELFKIFNAEKVRYFYLFNISICDNNNYNNNNNNNNYYYYYYFFQCISYIHHKLELVQFLL